MDFVSREVRERVISRSEEVFEGRRLLIKDGKNFEGRPAVKAQRYHAHSMTIPKVSGGGGRVSVVENGEGTAKVQEVQDKSEKPQREKRVKKVQRERVEV